MTTDSEIKFCPSCGKPFPHATEDEIFNFCPNCAYSLKEVPQILEFIDKNFSEQKFATLEIRISNNGKVLVVDTKDRKTTVEFK
jgi:predicted amidophosphoribosyltransferase